MAKNLARFAVPTDAVDALVPGGFTTGQGARYKWYGVDKANAETPGALAFDATASPNKKMMLSIVDADGVNRTGVYGSLSGKTVKVVRGAQSLLFAVDSVLPSGQDWVLSGTTTDSGILAVTPADGTVIMYLQIVTP